VIHERHTVALPGGELALVLHLPDTPGPTPCVLACHGLSASKDSDKYLLLAQDFPEAGLALAVLFGGAVVIETVFTLPGVGRLLVNAVVRRDYAVVQGTLLLVALWYVLVNMAVDFLYTVSDPRVRLRAS